jgi:anhydro-N-acetylmuramic acid kinase
MLIDAQVRRAAGGVAWYDRDGRHAARGRVDEDALAAMLRDPYFSLPPPKSTGRERFGEAFLDAPPQRVRLRALSLDDACATLTAFTARTVAAAVRTVAPAGTRVLASGGGANNPTLMRHLAEALRGYCVERAARVGIDVDAKEAVAFAILGYEALRGRPAGLPRVTGARGPRVLGSVAPLELGALLAKIERELAAAGSGGS